MSHIITPKLAVPFRLHHDGTKAHTVEQDSLEEITQCVETILKTPLGSRMENPEFGVPDSAFLEGGADLEDLALAISQWEPRADVILERDPEVLEHWVDNVNITVGKGA